MDDTTIKPAIVKMDLDPNEFYNTYKNVIMNTGILSNGVKPKDNIREISDTLCSQINTTGLMNVEVSLIQKFIPNKDTRDDLLDNMAAAILIDYLYISSVAAAASTTIAVELYNAYNTDADTGKSMQRAKRPQASDAALLATKATAQAAASTPVRALAQAQEAAAAGAAAGAAATAAAVAAVGAAEKAAAAAEGGGREEDEAKKAADKKAEEAKAAEEAAKVAAAAAEKAAAAAAAVAAKAEAAEIEAEAEAKALAATNKAVVARRNADDVRASAQQAADEALWWAADPSNANLTRLQKIQRQNALNARAAAVAADAARLEKIAQEAEAEKAAALAELAELAGAGALIADPPELVNSVQVIAVPVVYGSNTTPAARAIGDLTFNGNNSCIVIMQLPYGKQYIFSETVTFKDDSVYTASNVGDVITIGQPSGYDPRFKPLASVLEAVILIAAKQSKSKKLIKSVLHAVKKRAKESDAEAADVKNTLEIYADATGEKLNIDGKLSFVSSDKDKKTGYTTKYAVLSKDTHDLESIRKDEIIEFTDDVTINFKGVSVDKNFKSGSIISGTQVRVGDGVILFIGGAPANSFPALMQSYCALRNIYVFKRDSIELLAAGLPLPDSNRVSWAPDGLSAGTLFRDIGRSIVVPGASGNHIYYFRNVQWINGSGSEGVSGSPADVDAWGTGWICTWADDGIPFTSF
jgi:hypothetical protein